MDETIVISDEERSEEEQETKSDREFIDETEIVHSPSEHRRVDNDEVRERLRDLGHTIETETPQKCRWCEEEVYNITEHEKNCTHKKYPCFSCGVLFTPLVIKAHHKYCRKVNKNKKPVIKSSITVTCYKCKEDISITNIKQHATQCKAGKKPHPKKKQPKKKKAKEPQNGDNGDENGDPPLTMNPGRGYERARGLNSISTGQENTKY